MNEPTLEKLLNLYEEQRHNMGIFMKGVVEYIGEHPELHGSDRRIVHSWKSRLKDPEHLREKILRKIRQGTAIDVNNLFTQITDLAGVRILHLFQEDFEHIDRIIRRKVDEDKDWVFHERPKAYTWDPEASHYFSKFDLDVEQKLSFYTSVHYLVRPRVDSLLCCEVQVRTLFEEIWGEVDHYMNYPCATEDIALKEQIAVLSKIVGAGSRLLDALRRVHQLK